MTICYFGNYDPEYPRNKNIIKGLEVNGVEVTKNIDRTPGPTKFIRLIKKYWPERRKFDLEEKKLDRQIEEEDALIRKLQKDPEPTKPEKSERETILEREEQNFALKLKLIESELKKNMYVIERYKELRIELIEKKDYSEKEADDFIDKLDRALREKGLL